MKYIFTLLCVLFFLVFIPDNIISQVKYEKHLLQFCAGKFENYVKFDMGNELARELHPRLWRIIANISECEVHFCYNKDESEPIILKIQGKIKIDYPSLTYEAPNGPVALSRYPAKMDEVLPSSKMSFSFQINYYLRTRFGRTKSNWSILNLQDGVVQKFGGSHHFGEVWKKSRNDLIERGFQNPSRKKIYNNLQASFEIESFSNPHINPRRSISRFVENKQKRGKEGENTQENSFKEGNDESVDSTEELNDTTRTNQQTTSSSSLTNEQRKQQQQQKIAEIKEMERKAQGGAEEDNEKQSAREFHEEHTKKNNDRVKKQQEQKKVEEQKRKEEQEKQEELRRAQALMEEKRKWEEQQEKQKQVQEQKQREREQTRENQQTAAELGVAAALVHLFIAKFIYADIPKVPDYYSFFNGNGMHHRIHSGYALGFMPYDVENRTVTLDLGIGYDFDLFYGENGRLGVSVGGNFGHMIQQLRYDFNYGLNGSFGSKPVKLNLGISQHRSMIKHSDWIDASSNYENKELWQFSRFSVGPRISWEEYNVHLDLMLGLNFHRGYKKTMTSFRANLRTHYEFEMFLEYNQLPLTSDYFGPPEKSGALMIGLHRSWDYFIDGSRDYVFEDLRIENYFDDHWYFSFANPIISWGNLRKGSKRAEINQPNLAFTVFTVEKEFPITTNFTISGGLGFTTRRGFSGNVKYSNGATQSFIEGTSHDFTERINLFSKGEIDIPIGLTYYFKSDKLNRFWSTVKVQPSFNLGTKQRFVNGNSEVNGFEDGNNFNTKIGFGMDLPKAKYSNYRIGLYHIWTRGFTKIPYFSKLRGVQLKFAIGI